MHTVHPTPEQVVELQYMRFQHHCPSVQKRAEIVLLVVHYLAYGKIAKILDVCPNTVTNTLAMFESGGIARLARWLGDDTDGELSAFDSLMHEHWREHPPSTIKEAAAQLEEITGVKRRPTAVQAFMKRLGFKRRKAGSVPGKANQVKQRQLVHEVIEPRVSAAQAGDGVVFFMDASHFVFGAFLGYVWCLARGTLLAAPC